MPLQFRDEARMLSGELISLRHDFHRHPELAFQETRTAARVAEYLNALGYDVRSGVGRTGVVGVLKGSNDSPAVALRADMDALPVTEETGVEYTSENPGVMHACGHDTHVTSLLGAAKLLAAHKSELHGTVKVIFQPAEEVVGGARAMITDGVMENPAIDMIFGLHCDPQTEVGRICVKEGPLMAASDTFKVMITGRGGHGAFPHVCVDPVVAAAAVIMNLQTLVSRNSDPRDPAVLTIGMIHGGTANNIISEKVEMEGTVRTFNSELRNHMEEWLTRTAVGTAESLGAGAKVEYKRGVPAVFNTPAAARIATESITKVAGEAAVSTPVPAMGGEDFAFYLDRVPGCFLWLGVGNAAKGIVHPWHSPRFNVDESGLWLGAALLAQCAVDAMEELKR